ncbi:Hydroxyisourate hydrolase [Ascodesmis nigricans]|uniref:5-hydroxyisourate hydrolase n=1 Tax=Ascodesmis nigricans TaxID=341454 RepID=A0A4S2MS38_9PEZI|nr:Hydroxyisourate hydrolase [Ascodesmis nigricans]
MSSPKPPVTCHVLDTVKGRPAKGITCRLHQLSAAGTQATLLVTGTTNDDGRVTTWDGPLKLQDGGVYKMVFETGPYFAGDTFFPIVEITFNVKTTAEHYHIPLLLAPWSYSTYRGS